MGDASNANVRLGSAEGDLLLAIVYSLYRTIREAERWPAILQQVQELLGAQACSLSIHDFRARTGSIAIHSGCYDDYFLRLYRDRYAAQDPWLKREEHHRSAGSTWLGDELVPQAQLLTTEFYQRWMRPQGLMHQCSSVLFRDRQHLVQLTSYRSARAKPFDRATLYPLQRLLPHIRQTLDLQHQLVGAETGRTRPLGDVVHKLASTTPVVVAERRLLEASTSAEDMPDTEGGLASTQDTSPEKFADKFPTVIETSIRTAGTDEERSVGGTPRLSAEPAKEQGINTSLPQPLDGPRLTVAVTELRGAAGREAREAAATLAARCSR